jgi:hypothetical protein
MVSSSFFTDGGTYDTATVTSSDVPGSSSPSQAPSGFYPEGNLYDYLSSESEVVALLQQLAATTTTNASAAATSATNAATSAAGAGSAAAAAIASAAGTATPLIDGTAAVGTSTKWAHEDHRHPTDTSRADAAATTAALALKADKTYVDTQDALKAPLASPALTGAPTAPTATAGTNTTQLATTAFVQTALPVVPAAATATPLVDGTAAVGVATKYAREDHVHPAPPFSAITSKPTTVAGYGISDALTSASFPAWSTYTVTVGGLTGGTVTASGRFFKIGKLVFVTIVLNITSTLTGTMTVSLPATSAGSVALAAKETAVSGIGGTAFGSGAVLPLLKDDGTQFLTTGMNIIISGTYEAA